MEESAKLYNTRELLKADVVELATGSLVGTVAETIVNTAAGTVEYVGILPAQWYMPGLLLRAAEIIGFDENILLIKSRDRLLDYKESRIKKDCAASSDISALTLIDQEGHVYGKPVGAVFDPTGRIIAFEAEKDLVVHVVELGRIVAVGDRFIVVSLRGAREAGTGEDGGTPKPAEAPKQRAVPDESERVAASPRLELEDDSDLQTKYRERQFEYLLGKRSPMTLNGRGGTPLVKMGETLTSKAISVLIGEGLLDQVFMALTVDRGSLKAEDDLEEALS
jgi:uncharacterized protein YrrD